MDIWSRNYILKSPSQTYILKKSWHSGQLRRVISYHKGERGIFCFMKQDGKIENLIHILTLFYILPLAFFLIANTLFSLTQTTYMELYLDTEKPLYKADSPLFLLLITLIFLLICGFLFNKREISSNVCRKAERMSLFFAAIMCLTIIFLFRVRVAADSASLSNSAIAFLSGDYSSLREDGYLSYFPHQLGMVGFLQIIYFLFGIENFTLLQFFNVIAIVFIIYYLHRIAEELFGNNYVRLMLSVLCIGMLPLFLYSTLIYGDIPGLGFVVPAMYYIIRYLNTERKFLLIPALVCMTFSVIFKSNNSVILAAAVIMLVLHCILQKKPFSIVFAAALIAGPVIANSCINAYYGAVSGLGTVPSGIPKIAWIAMGLQENDYIESGWYNSYNMTIYYQCGYDSAKATEASIASIKESLMSFVSAPRSSGLRFFYKKFISQWNDPGYLSQITVEWYSRHRDDHSSLALYLIYGNGRFIVEGIMNIYQFLVLVGASIYTVSSIRKWSLSGAFLSLCVFGGYFFHMFWEAKGRYGLGYFVMCVPMAAYGLWILTKALYEFVSSRFTTTAGI